MAGAGPLVGDGHGLTRSALGSRIPLPGHGIPFCGRC